jgi:hypothetical protein
MFPSHNSAEFVRINRRCTEQIACLFLYNLIDLIMGTLQEFLHERFTRVGEWSVPDIMEEGCGNYQRALIIRKPKPA